MFLNVYRDLEDGDLFEALGYDIVIQRRTLPAVCFPTGKLVACDPLTHPTTEPFDFELEPGNYPVRLIIAQLRDEARLAQAILEIHPEPAKRWEVATVPGEDTSLLSEDDHGYSVVSSLACFMDVETAAHMIQYGELVLDDDDNEVEKQLKIQQRKALTRGLCFNKIAHPALGEGHIALFSSGYGEGLYRTWIGRDADGKITRVVTDFEVLEMRFPSFSF